MCRSYSNNNNKQETQFARSASWQKLFLYSPLGVILFITLAFQIFYKCRHHLCILVWPSINCNFSEGFRYLHCDHEGVTVNPPYDLTWAFNKWPHDEPYAYTVEAINQKNVLLKYPWQSDDITNRVLSAHTISAKPITGASWEVSKVGVTVTSDLLPHHH